MYVQNCKDFFGLAKSSEVQYLVFMMGCIGCDSAEAGRCRILCGGCDVAMLSVVLDLVNTAALVKNIELHTLYTTYRDPAGFDVGA